MNALDPTVAISRTPQHQRTEKKRRLNAMIDGATADDPSASQLLSRGAAFSRDRRYDRAYLFDCAERRIAAGLFMPTANAETMSRHRDAINRKVSPGLGVSTRKQARHHGVR